MFLYIVWYRKKSILYTQLMYIAMLQQPPLFLFFVKDLL